ncbi:MAG TPA: GGDEF domain-containing protein [Thiobacillaceae bacterium]|nr:GGDEF domain-containing protein [Thiobacillaceae bacterium]HNU63852.1 GGDEF domain-containing protein [Thiobacillaceae bacterium]
MAQTPNVIALAVMQRLKETGEAPTPENYQRVYYEIAGVQAGPPEAAEGAQNNTFCLELLKTLREMVQDMSEKTESLAKDLGEKNKDLSGNVDSLKHSRDKAEILRLLGLVVSQAGGIQNRVEASHRELVETRHALVSIQSELSETRQLLNEDALTGALNRRGLDQVLEREVARCQRNKARLSLAMVDLDHFKKINDTYGHAVGDQMLVHFTSLIRSVLRKSDALVRYGGEEFILVLPETDLRGAMLVLGRLQQVMRKSPLVSEGRTIHATFSAGVSALREEDNGHSLLRRADETLYQAKNAGRDRIITLA